jgi:Cd(II)/Pb(II)-responsive transcriptional regulator
LFLGFSGDFKMKIGQLASQTGTAVETIRYYEREGLLPGSRRTERNYRVYDPSHANRLAFIRHCRSLDMTLDEIRVLLRLKDRPQENCAEANALLDEHIGHVAKRIGELHALEVQLKALRALCTQAHTAKDCGILQRLGYASAHSPSQGTQAVAHIAGAHGRRRST